MIPYYESKNKPKQSIVDLEAAREILMKEDYKMDDKRRLERLYNMMQCKSYIRNDKIPENKEIFVYAFKNIKTEKIGTYTLIGCESDELYENDKLTNFWSNKFVNKVIETRNFRITRWFFLP